MFCFKTSEHQKTYAHLGPMATYAIARLGVEIPVLSLRRPIVNSIGRVERFGAIEAVLSNFIAITTKTQAKRMS